MPFPLHTWRSPLLLLDRYIIRHILIALLALTGGATALIWLTQSLRFISMIVQHGLSLLAFFHLTSLMLPSFINIILPITTFLVVLWLYQRLANDRELTILQTAGLSSLRLAYPGLLCALFATFISYSLSLWGAPLAYRHFHNYELEIRNKTAAFLLEEGVFTPISNSLTVYIHQRRSDNSFRGILIEDTRTPGSPVTILAEDGTTIPHGDTLELILHNGSRQVINQHTGQLTMLTFALDRLEFGTTHSHVSSPDVAEMPLQELFHPQGPLSPHYRKKLTIEGWTRLTNPLACLAYSMVGLICVLRSRFSRHGNITRPTIAVLLVVGMIILSLILKNLAERNLGLVPLLWGEMLLPTLIGSTLLGIDHYRKYTLSFSHH